VTQIVNNLPNYKDSQVWQDLMRFKATQKDLVSDGTSSKLRKQFSIRSPLNLSKLAEKKSLSTAKQEVHDSQLMQTTKYTTSGFFPQLNTYRT